MPFDLKDAYLFSPAEQFPAGQGPNPSVRENSCCREDRADQAGARSAGLNHGDRWPGQALPTLPERKRRSVIRDGFPQRAHFARSC